MAEARAKNQCANSYEQAQVSRQTGDLLSAKKELVFCASVGCPEAMHDDCDRWLEEVQAALPSVGFEVKSASGEDIADARLVIDDGAELPLDGRAISVNPGKHSVSVSARGFVSLHRTLQFVEGQKLRRELVVLMPESGSEARPAHKADPTPSPHRDARTPRARATDRHLTVVQWVGGGLGVAGAVGFAVFGRKARNGEDDLDRCRPACRKDDVSDVKRDYVLANLSLGVGVFGLATAVVQYLAQGGSAAPASARLTGPSPVRAAFQVQVQPSSVSLLGRF